MLGYGVDDLIGEDQHEIIHHTHANGVSYNKVDCPIHASAKHGTVQLISDEVFWRKGGSNFPVEYASAPLLDNLGAITGAVVTFKDITERKKTENALIQSEQQNKSITQTAAEAIITIDANGKILSWNNAAETIFGHSAEKMINSELNNIVPDQYLHMHRDALKHLRNGVCGVRPIRFI